MSWPKFRELLCDPRGFMYDLLEDCEPKFCEGDFVVVVAGHDRRFDHTPNADEFAAWFNERPEAALADGHFIGGSRHANGTLVLHVLRRVPGCNAAPPVSHPNRQTAIVQPASGSLT